VRPRNLAAFLLLVITVFLVPSLSFAAIGEVLGAKPGASITSDGSVRDVTAGMQVNSGDVIRTDAEGVVQLLFADNTKIAVGPNSEVTLDVSMMRGQQQANSFVMNAIGGSFRFISGDSNSEAYKINTVSATMGIRGTIFDFWIGADDRTLLAILSGAVDLCALTNTCTEVTGACDVGYADTGGNAGGLFVKDQVAAVLIEGFPFILSQAGLARPLRANVESCDRYFAQSDDPPPPPPPPIVPQQEGDFPGTSGPTGPSEGRGGGVSANQNGTGTGKGRGPEMRAH